LRVGISRAEAVITLIPAGTLPEETVLRINAPVLLLTLGVTFLSTVLCDLRPRCMSFAAMCSRTSQALAKGPG